MVHKHGCYWRYAEPEATLQERIQRYLCRPCGLTFSVLPAHRLPYRPIRAERLQRDFDRRAGIQTPGLDPIGANLKKYSPTDSEQVETGEFVGAP